MLQFYVVVVSSRNNRGRFELRRLQIKEDIRADLSNEFLKQADEFVVEKYERIPFQASCPTAPRNTVLVTNDFALPEDFVEDVVDRSNSDLIRPEDLNERNVTAVVGAQATDDEKVRRAIFKEMRGAKIIDQKSTSFFLRSDTLTRNDHPGLVIPESVTAVYEDESLYFRSYYTTKRFLEIDEGYASDLEADALKFLGQAPVVFEGENSLFETAGLRSRERISRILSKRVWEQDGLSVKEICRRASTANIIIDSQNGGETMLLPNDPTELGQVLKFLDQGIYRTMLTNELMETQASTMFKPT